MNKEFDVKLGDVVKCVALLHTDNSPDKTYLKGFGLGDAKVGDIFGYVVTDVGDGEVCLNFKKIGHVGGEEKYD